MWQDKNSLELRQEEEYARLEVPLYRQMTDFTCGACAALMVWKYDRKVQLSRRNEFLIWAETIALPYKFSSPYRITAFFIKKGFETKLIMEQRPISIGKTPLECYQVDPAERKLFLDFFKAYNEILKRQIASAILDRKPTLPDIRRALINRSPAILLVDSYYTLKGRGAQNPPHQPHWVVVTGYEDEKFYINDPIHETGLKPGKMMLEASVLREAMDTYRRFRWPPALIVVKLKASKSIPRLHRVGLVG